MLSGPVFIGIAAGKVLYEKVAEVYQLSKAALEAHARVASTDLQH